MRITGVATTDHKYEQCQMPITIDENLRFVVQFDDIDELTCGVKNTYRGERRRQQCSHVHTLHPPALSQSPHPSNSKSPSPNRTKSKTAKSRIGQYPHVNSVDNDDYTRKTFKEDMKQHFTERDLNYVGKAAKKDLNVAMKRAVPCIGCRKAVENMFDLVTKRGHKISNKPLPASPTDSAVSSPSTDGASLSLEKDGGGGTDDMVYPEQVFNGLSFNRSHEMTLEDSILHGKDPMARNALYNFLFVFGSRHAGQIEGMRTKKTNNRCALHSLDSRGGLDLKNKHNRLRIKQNGDMGGLDNDNQFVPGTNASYLSDSGIMKSTVGNVGYFGMSSIASREELKDTWWSVWRMLTNHCKKEICCLDSKQLLDVVHSYLERHSFCIDCRAQIHKAYYKLCPKSLDANERALVHYHHNEPPENENLYQSSHGTDSAGEGSQESDHLGYDGKPCDMGLNRSEASSIQMLEESDEYVPAEKTRVLSNSTCHFADGDSLEELSLEQLQALKSDLLANGQHPPAGHQHVGTNVRTRLNDQTGQFESLSDGDFPASDNRMTPQDRRLRELVERGKAEIEKKRQHDMKKRNGNLGRRQDEYAGDVRPEEAHLDDGRSQSSIPTSEDSEFINQFDPLVFRGLRFCMHENGGRQHVHVTTHDDDIKMLLTRAENEIIHQFGSNAHARHAKTMVQAQHEILVCIGIFIYERLHRVWYAWQSCSQTAPLLASLALETMRNKYDEILEEKQGGPMEKYEKLCQELDLVDKLKEDKAEKKREKKKRQKAKKNELKLKKQEQAALAQERLQTQKQNQKLNSPSTPGPKISYEPIMVAAVQSDMAKMTSSKNSLDNALHSSSGSSIGLGKPPTFCRNDLKINATSNGFDTSSNASSDESCDDDDIMREMRAFREKTDVDKVSLRRKILERFEACTIMP